ncbi:MAG: tail fiber domain-containing protein [Bacteroidales bacterium]|jgi:hypothetical protein|nr:tail fiber domain-containing protein [Bacteroidales bacterium]
MKKFTTTILTLLLVCCICSLNAQLKVNSDNIVSINNKAPRAGVYPAPIIDIGAQFIPSTATIIRVSGNMTASSTVNTMAFAGSSSNAAAGTKSNHLAVVYSNIYYTNGPTLGILSSSDVNLKTNIIDLPPMSDKILKLRPVTYDFVKTSSGEDVSKDPFYKNCIGFIAQEVGEIFPDLVFMDENKLYSLDYSGLIPYLTKALQEQSEINKEQEKTIENLQDQINKIQQMLYSADFNQSPKSPETSQIMETEIGNILHQNAPNPFNISTTIKYQLSDNATNAKICIYNLTGKQLQCYNLQATKGESSIEVRASSLQAGMYLYSLIVGDKLIDTKRMVLTE